MFHSWSKIDPSRNKYLQSEGLQFALATIVKRALIPLIFFVAQALPPMAWAQVSCKFSVNKSPPLETTYKQIEVVSFLRTQNILPEKWIQKIEQRSNLFRLQNEDMGNAILIHALSTLGTQPSRQKDLLVQRFLKPLFNHYLSEFQNFTSQLPKGWNLRVHNLFGLSRLGFIADAYGIIHWRQEDSAYFIQLMKTEFSKTMNFDLVAANRLLVQMAFLHSNLSGEKGMSLSQLKTASDQYLLAESIGHTFMPTIGEWDIANSAAQWHLNTTFNMLPLKLNKKTHIHGGDGLSAIEGITHDQSHVMNWRLGVMAEALGLNLKSSQDRKVILDRDNQLRTQIENALVNLKKSSDGAIDSKMLLNVIFFFIHQPEPLKEYIQSKARLNSSLAQKALVYKMRQSLEESGEFYPMIGNHFEQFEKAAEYWIQTLVSSNE